MKILVGYKVLEEMEKVLAVAEQYAVAFNTKIYLVSSLIVVIVPVT